MANRNSSQLVLGLALVPAAAIVGALYAQAPADSVDVDTMLDVSVSIETVSHVSIDRFGDSVWKSGSGSGFVVSNSPCRVWTNHHVVEDAAIIRVSPRGDVPPIEAKLVSSTQRPDIAVLELDSCAGLPVAKLGDSDELRVGQRVFAVGNPFGRNPDSVSSGIISHLERYTDDTVPYLQTDASINPGNSGGALFNARGEVVGINTAIASSGGKGASGIGYALPITLARTTIESLGGVEQGWGDLALDGSISNLSAEEAEIFGLDSPAPAVIVTAEVANGPAAGLLEQHDIIVDLAGAPVRDLDSLKRLASDYAPGSVVEVGVVRGSQMERVELAIADGRAPQETDEAEDASSYSGHLGMTLESWHERDKEVGHIDRPVIARVHDLGPAHVAGIQSSQRGAQRRGPYMMPVQLTVSALTGLVVAGNYSPVASVEEAETIASQAYARGESVLVEIELWTRDKDAPAVDLKSRGKAFYALAPRPDASDSVVAARADGPAEGV